MLYLITVIRVDTERYGFYRKIVGKVERNSIEEVWQMIGKNNMFFLHSRNEDFGVEVIPLDTVQEASSAKDLEKMIKGTALLV